MSKPARTLMALALVVAGCTSATAESTSTVGLGAGGEGCPMEGEELATAMLFIEHNATDTDTGVQGNFGGEAWTELCIWDPDGQLILTVQPQASLATQGMADLFFESREPTNDEQTIEEMFGLFPEGEYLIGARGFDGVPRVATATFTHAIPAEPNITSPELAEEEAAGDVIVARSGLVVAWEPVVETISGDPVVITSYEVILTKVEHDDSNGFSQPIYDVHLGPNATSLSVPEEFLEPGTVYELEVLAIEFSGNQTIALGFFTTD